MLHYMDLCEKQTKLYASHKFSSHNSLILYVMSVMPLVLACLMTEQHMPTLTI